MILLTAQPMTQLFDNWYLPCLISTLLYGFFNFGSKISSAKGYKAPLTVLISTFTVFICASITFWFCDTSVPDWKPVFILACSNGFLFALSSLLTLFCFERVPGNIGFPLKKLNTIFVIILSIVIYNTFPNTRQWIGIGLAIFSILLLSTNKASQNSGLKKGFGMGMLMGITAALCTAVAALINKKGAMDLDKTAFVMVSYGTAFIMSLLFLKINLLHSKAKNRSDMDNEKSNIESFYPCKSQILLGLGMGVTNFIGFMLILTAFSLGPLHIIHPIFSTSMVVSVILSTLIYKEQMDLKIITAIICVLIAVVIVK